MGKMLRANVFRQKFLGKKVSSNIIRAKVFPGGWLRVNGQERHVTRGNQKVMLVCPVHVNTVRNNPDVANCENMYELEHTDLKKMLNKTVMFLACGVRFYLDLTAKKRG